MHDHVDLKQRSALASNASAAFTDRRSAPPLRNISQKNYAHYLARPILQIVPLVFATSVIISLYVGWIIRDEGYLTAESGLGYWLGIAGASLMLLMLLYPLRKRVRALRWLGSVPSWFRLHMLCGILGPTLIVFHTNFRLGSLNSNVALATMLIVVVSGIAGRYLYAKVHRGLYGSSIKVREILDDTECLRHTLVGAISEAAEPIVNELQAIEVKVLAPKHSFVASLWNCITSGYVIRRSQYRILREVRTLMARKSKGLNWSRRQQRRQIQTIESELRFYFAAVRKAARYAVFERMLALWHILHMPLFVLLIVTAVIHVIAVHLY